MSKLSKWMTLTLRCRETTSADFKWRLRLGRENPDSEENSYSLAPFVLGPFLMLAPFFVDCGADDIFMDSKLAEELRFLSPKLSNPITLRLADGDSSSTLTHRTVPLQAAHRKACEDSVVLRHQSLSTDCSWDTPGWSDIIPGLIGCQGWFDFDSPYCSGKLFRWIN
ncbi:hypothetical protein BASA81_018148 [Batrachochytrium salamandrivorans]|nr:hypothetical protein BASA81_018148 [Batrachochytrium salamandrivorans]